jgi:hypothetical protein
MQNSKCVMFSDDRRVQIESDMLVIGTLHGKRLSTGGKYDR